MAITDIGSDRWRQWKIDKNTKDRLAQVLADHPVGARDPLILALTPSFAQLKETYKNQY